MASQACTAKVPAISKRMAATDHPPISKILTHIAASGRDVLTLAQGISHWGPPPACLEAARQASSEPETYAYGPDEGLPELRRLLKEKVETQNGLEGYDVVVTPGANQAFMNVVLATLDPGDGVVLFKPYYFNHHMALQMTGLGPSIVYGPCTPEHLHPDLDWLEAALARPSPPRMVVLVNPCNPTGAVLARGELERAARACAAAGAWLVVDDTYEDFVFGGEAHCAVAGPHVVHLFSLSKAYGLAGWRVGYVAHGAGPALASALLRAQDTMPICAAQASQRGAIYFWARLPGRAPDDEAFVAWAIRRHGVSVVPGSAAGSPGFIRVSYANAPPETIGAAAERLERALVEFAACEGGELPQGAA
ncbi:Aspartate aminotransferase [Auxenochlorella protothecoides]|uniref:Aspartate aminotransferase n=1 Tax=Auxenochlorella protothecoides TaxID=3075 RepID=A0A087SF67_AUXPR|nr:Aspartate aminotransferase [Auxenochlorella protothecoides]KFM24371.1 Aspartate aminotransferase [Auxenochlorella protothecoides]